MKKYSELKIILSNCLSGGTGWSTITSNLITNIQNEIQSINDLEFKRVNSNTVRGEHNAFTIILTGVYFNLKQKQNREDASKLLEYIRNAANKITELTYSEIRIEYTRNYVLFSEIPI